MEVENRIETFGGQVDELPDELKDRRRMNGHGGSGDNGVILEEDEDSGDGENGVEKLPAYGTAAATAGRVIKKVKQHTWSHPRTLTLTVILYIETVHTFKLSIA